MNSVELDEKVDLQSIVNISEDDFKRQISAWIDEHGISRKLQSKLRADLFEHFNRTKLGRQMAEEHKLAHRIVLSPLVLVLNTLVAEFLYTEDCHFSLSVFANEVPYKNTLPNFDVTPSREYFRFSASELNDIFEAIGISKQNEQVARKLYTNLATNNQDVTNKSLIHCIIKTLTGQIDTVPNNKATTKVNTEIKTKKTARCKVREGTSSTSRSTSCDTSSRHDQFRQNSRYSKYLNQYLDILSSRINDISRSLDTKCNNKDSTNSKQTHINPIVQEEKSQKDLRKIIHNVNKLSKPHHKCNRFQDIYNSIENLSNSVNKYSEKFNEIPNVANAQAKTTKAEPIPSDNQDRFGDLNYVNWLRALKTSENGKQFIDRLEDSLQKTMEKERENLEKLYEEKTNNYRMLIRLHYKQKYDTKVDPVIAEQVDKDDDDSNNRLIPTNMAKTIESLTAEAFEKEQMVDNIVQTAKYRFRQLEQESEDLDLLFQSYLRRQNMLKQQTNNDATKIWQNYTLSKAALAQNNSLVNRSSVGLGLNENSRSNQVINSTFKDDVDIDEILKDLNEINQLRSPRFDKNGAFAKGDLLPEKLQRNKNQPNEINYQKDLLKNHSKLTSVEIVREITSQLQNGNKISIFDNKSKDEISKLNKTIEASVKNTEEIRGKKENNLNLGSNDVNSSIPLHVNGNSGSHESDIDLDRNELERSFKAFEGQTNGFTVKMSQISEMEANSKHIPVVTQSISPDDLWI